eukprot:526824_1
MKQHIPTKITEEEKQLLLKICQKIVDYPDNDNWRNLNIDKILNRHGISSNCIEVLISAGFKRNDDKKRLILHENDIKEIKKLYSSLTDTQNPLQQTQHDILQLDSVRELMEFGVSANDALLALNMSLEPKQSKLRNVLANINSASIDISMSSGKPADEKSFILENDNNLNNSCLSQIIELMRTNISFNEAESAVAMSIGSKYKLHQNLDMDEAVQLLQHNGFDRNESMDALVAATYNIKKALQILFKHIEKTNTEMVNYLNQEQQRMVKELMNDGYSKDEAILTLNEINNIDNVSKCDIDSCCHLILVKKMFIKYNAYQHTCHDSLDIESILNSFHHLLCVHDSEKDFEEIYNILGKCDILKCNIFKRNRRKRNKKENNSSYIDDIMDKIHCYFQHSYDIGFRLYPNERKQIEVVDHNEEKYESNPLSIDNESGNLSNACNKFMHADDDIFSSGERYVYWKYNPQYVHGNLLQKLYKARLIYAKYDSLKKEILAPEKGIPMAQWDNELKKAQIHKNSHYAKQFKAIPDNSMKVYHMLQDGRIFGIKKGSEIKINHLVAVMFYCNYNNLPYQFSKTYRREQKDDHSDDDWKQYVDADEKNSFTNPNILYTSANCKESEASVKGRHCKFYHLAKFLNEVIHVYSPKAIDTNYYKVYHGINKKMKFNSMRNRIFCPLSTTKSYEIAINFAGHNGFVLELLCDRFSKYFDCAWVSDFPNEKEILFINTMPGVFQFINIIDTTEAIQYDKYIKALSIFDAAMHAKPFQPDTEVLQNIRKWQSESGEEYVADIPSRWSKNQPCLEKLGATFIHAEWKILTLKLIKHELHRYKPNKFNKMEDIPIYIEGLLHFICSRKVQVMLDLDLMSMEMKNIYHEGGYNGYFFLKSLFCKHNLENMIDLDFILLLFPNVAEIVIGGIQVRSSISTLPDCFDYLLSFITNHQQLMCSRRLVFTNWPTRMANWLMYRYYNAFQAIGWNIRAVTTGIVVGQGGSNTWRDIYVESNLGKAILNTK